MHTLTVVRQDATGSSDGDGREHLRNMQGAA